MFNAGTTFNIYTDVKEVVIRANEKIYDIYIYKCHTIRMSVKTTKSGHKAEQLR